MKRRSLTWTPIAALGLCALVAGVARTQAKQESVPSTPASEAVSPLVEDEQKVKGEYLRAFQVAWADMQARNATWRQKQEKTSSPPLEISDFEVGFASVKPTKQTPYRMVSVAFERHITVARQPGGFSLSNADSGFVYGVRLSDYTITGITLEQ